MDDDGGKREEGGNNILLVLYLLLGWREHTIASRLLVCLFSPFNLLSLIFLAVGIVSSIALLISSSFAGWEAFLHLYFVESFIFLSYQLDRTFHPQFISPWSTIFL